MRCRLVASLVLAGALAGCGRPSWPDPPPVDPAAYEREYKEWREGQQQTASDSTKIIGIWPLQNGDTPFGSEQSLPNARWRIAARFDAFDTPKPIRIADVRGGFSDGMAAGHLTFRVDGREHHLIVMKDPGSDQFFMMFKDATNSTTTYGSRIMTTSAVASGQFTVLDFNLARNPPCAYSSYTTCPLPPAENRLAVAVDAGEKRFPLNQGFSLQ